MTNDKTGGPAFMYEVEVSQNPDVNKGLTVWHYFAAHAPEEIKECIPATAKECAALLGIEIDEYIPFEHYPRALAITCGRYADAMIEECKKRSSAI